MRNTKQKRQHKKRSPETKITINGSLHFYDVGKSYPGSQLLKTTGGDVYVYPCDKWHEEN